MLDIKKLAIPGVQVLTPNQFNDDRGFFSEVYNRRTLSKVGIDTVFVQDNHSLSKSAGTVRGLHFQIEPHPIEKLVRVISGSVLDVVVDLRRGSPTFGEHTSVELSASNWKQIYVPVGLAHGFCTLEPHTEVAYKVTDYWSPDSDRGVAWDDPDLAIDWPVKREQALLSDRDLALPALTEIPPYFTWEIE